MQDKVHVLFSFHNTDYYSGATRSLLDLIDQFVVDNSIEVFAVFPEKSGSAVEYLREKGVKVTCCPVKALLQNEKQELWKRIVKFPLFFKWYADSVREVKKLAGFLKENHIDVVYSNTSVNLVGALIKKQFGIPNIWHFREYRHEDHQIHYFLGDKRFIQFANKYSDRMIFISQSMYEFHREKGCDASKMTMVYNDVSPRYIIQRDWNEKTDEYRLLIAGDVKEGKGQLEAIKAVKIVIDQGYHVRLAIAGKFVKDSYGNSVIQYIDENGLNGKVELLGKVQDMNDLRKNCHLGIVASKKEAFGRVTVEGMLAGMAMIGSNTGGTLELIQNNKNGLLYEMGNPEDLAKKIIELITNRKHMLRIAQNSQQQATELFASGKCYSTIRRLLLENGRN